MVNERCQEIKLENGDKVIIGYHTRRSCVVCGEDIFTAVRDNKKIMVELVGLAQWNVHECK